MMGEGIDTSAIRRLAAGNVHRETFEALCDTIDTLATSLASITTERDELREQVELYREIAESEKAYADSLHDVLRDVWGYVDMSHTWWKALFGADPDGAAAVDAIGAVLGPRVMEGGGPDAD